jgi:hypothetical protein
VQGDSRGMMLTLDEAETLSIVLEALVTRARAAATE